MTHPGTSGAEVEGRAIDTVRAVKNAVTIPVAVKLSPFYTALAHLARELDRVGADGLVLFNRFYQPDIDADQLAATRTLHLSDSSELLLRLHWIAILSGQVRPSARGHRRRALGVQRREGDDGGCARHSDGVRTAEAWTAADPVRC